MDSLFYKRPFTLKKYRQYITDHLEPILIPDDDRFVALPVKYQDLYQMYKSAVACFWTAEEVDLSKDLGDWGFTWGVGGFGLGNISSYTSEIEVCETNHSIDYKIVTDWIDKN